MAKVVRRERGDGFITLWATENGNVYKVVIQENEQEIMAQNHELQLNPSALKDIDGFRWALQIPEDHRLVLGLKYPDLNSPDASIHHKAWQKFMRSSESIPYRVRTPSKRGMAL